MVAIRKKVEASLSHSRLLELVVYDRHTGHFRWRLTNRNGLTNRDGLVPLGHVEKYGYRRIMLERKRFLAHRLAWFYVYGAWPETGIDHRNLNKDDNRISNLRLASSSQQAQNHAPKKSISGLKGANWNRFRNYWQSYIKVNGRSIFLGRFATKEQAHAAYCDAAKLYFGEFARVA